MSRITVEIFDRDTQEVKEEKHFKGERELDSFAFYFLTQCDNDKFGFRVKGE